MKTIPFNILMDIKTKSDFRGWIKALPTGAKFDYCDNDNCVIASFLREKHSIEARVGGTHWEVLYDASHLYEIPEWMSCLQHLDNTITKAALVKQFCVKL